MCTCPQYCWLLYCFKRHVSSHFGRIYLVSATVADLDQSFKILLPVKICSSSSNSLCQMDHIFTGNKSLKICLSSATVVGCYYYCCKRNRIDISCTSCHVTYLILLSPVQSKRISHQITIKLYILLNFVTMAKAQQCFKVGIFCTRSQYNECSQFFYLPESSPMY